ncbi:hypothetical protein ACA910_010021 [Epithemia clementina (nom. ined.)]
MLASVDFGKAFEYFSSGGSFQSAGDSNLALVADGSLVSSWEAVLCLVPSFFDGSSLFWSEADISFSDFTLDFNQNGPWHSTNVLSAHNLVDEFIGMILQSINLDILKARDFFKLHLNKLLDGVVYQKQHLAQEGGIIHLIIGISLPVLEVVVYQLPRLPRNVRVLAPNCRSKKKVTSQLQVELFSGDEVEEAMIAEDFFHLLRGDAIRLAHLTFEQVFVNVVVDGARIARPGGVIWIK